MIHIEVLVMTMIHVHILNLILPQSASYTDVGSHFILPQSKLEIFYENLAKFILIVYENL